MCFELDVVVTIQKDLEDEAMKEKQNEIQFSSQNEQLQAKQQLKDDLAQIQRMVSLFYFGPLKVLEEKKEVAGKPPVITKISIADQQAKFPDSLRNPYKFLSQLFSLMREQNKMSNEQKAVHNVYLENRSKFQWPRDDREAYSVLTDYFSQASFIKRIELH